MNILHLTDKKIVTVIIPTYKNFDLLKDCVDSVLSQNYPSLELVIVDDGSESFQGTYWSDYIEKNKKDNLVKYIVYSNKNNLGTVKSLNGAISKISGVYLKIIAADDLLYDNDVISKAVERSRSIQNDCFVCDVLLCDENLKEIGVADNGFIKSMEVKKPEECFSAICTRNNINATGVFFKTSFFEKNGLFDERFVLLEDWPTWLSIFRRGDKITYLNFIVAKRRVTTGVVSNGNPKYLHDRSLAWDLLIKGQMKHIGFKKYVASYFAAKLFTKKLIRKIAYLFLRKR